MDDNEGARFFYFLTGVGIGALIGVLFAPNSGEKTREVVASKAEEGRDFVVRKGRDVRDQATGYVERGKEKLEEQRDHLSAAVDAGKQAYRSEAQPSGAPEQGSPA